MGMDITWGCQGPVSISEKTSFRKISSSLEAARFVFRIVRSLWNSTGTLAAVLPMCLSNFKAIRQFKVPISWLRDFTRSYEKTYFRILRRGPDYFMLSYVLTPNVISSCSISWVWILWWCLKTFFSLFTPLQTFKEWVYRKRLLQFLSPPNQQLLRLNDLIFVYLIFLIAFYFWWSCFVIKHVDSVGQVMCFLYYSHIHLMLEDSLTHVGGDAYNVPQVDRTLSVNSSNDAVEIFRENYAKRHADWCRDFCVTKPWAAIS